jgi:hypothetical protein
MLNTRASQLSYNISAVEKNQAEKALICFKHTKKSLKSSIEYIDILYTPFKENPDIPLEEIIKYRAALRRFRDKAIENFNAFKLLSFECVQIMDIFSSDSQINKLIKTFISMVDDIQSDVNKFVDEFKDLKSKTFVSDIIKCIDNIKKHSDQLQEIIDDRVLSHIQENILSSTWIDDVSRELNRKIEKKTPLIVDLYNKSKENFGKGK